MSRFSRDLFKTEGRSKSSGGPSALASPLLPLTALAMLVLIYGAVAGYWLVFGDLPGLGATARHGQTMPARGGPESAQSALLQPPPGKVVLTAPERPHDAADDDGPPPPERAAVPEPPPVAIDPPKPPTPPVAQPPLDAIPQVAASTPRPPPTATSLPPPPAARPLSAVPHPELVRRSGEGGLPIIGPSGSEPWRYYARPFTDTGGAPRIAVLINGLGLSTAATEDAIRKLPADVSLAFTPYSRDLQTWIGRARDAGHEVLLDLPMEPLRYPARDPGPLGLLASLPAEQAAARLRSVMARGLGYVGLAGLPGSPFATAPAIAAVLDDMKKRGLLYVGEADTARVYPANLPAFAPISRVIDDQPFREAIDARLAQILQEAKTRGRALGIADSRPVTIERLALWLPTLADHGVVLAPVTAIAEPSPALRSESR